MLAQELRDHLNKIMPTPWVVVVEDANNEIQVVCYMSKDDGTCVVFEYDREDEVWACLEVSPSIETNETVSLILNRARSLGVCGCEED